MFGSAILDTAIGLILVFLIFSLIATALREVIEQFAKKRAKELELGIMELLGGSANKSLLARLYTHPLIAGLYEGGYEAKSNSLPSYIPSANFALALMDEIVRGSAKRNDVGGPAADASATAPVISPLELRRSIGTLLNNNAQRVVLTALDTAQGDLGRVQASIEAWYDSAMDRVSGRYKRYTQTLLIILGMVIAIVGNVNAVRIARYLYHDKTARDVVVAQAGVIAKDSSILHAHPDRLLRTVDSLNLPLGWPDGLWKGLEVQPNSVKPGAGDFPNLLIALAGWFMTALAISLGAPFWFDLLNKFMVIRSTVKPHEKSGEEGSEDGRSGGSPPKLGAPIASPSGATVPSPGTTQSGDPRLAVAGEGNTWANGNTDGDL